MQTFFGDKIYAEVATDRDYSAESKKREEAERNIPKIRMRARGEDLQAVARENPHRKRKIPNQREARIVMPWMTISWILFLQN